MPQTDIVTLSQQARAYLLGCSPAITDALIDRNLLQWQAKQNRRKTPALFYEALLRQVTRCDHKNRTLGKWLHPQSIQKSDNATSAPYLHELLGTALFHFDPRQVQTAYGRDSKKLLQALGGQKQLESISIQLGAKGKNSINAGKNWRKSPAMLQHFLQMKKSMTASKPSLPQQINAVLKLEWHLLRC